jgi:putative intracellular protease/amidase
VIRQRFLVLAVSAIFGASVAVASPPSAVATQSSHAAATGSNFGGGIAPVAAEAPRATAVSGRTTCQGSIDSVMTNLDGSAADQLEELQAKYENTDGFRAVVFSGKSAAIVVAPETVDAWRKALANSDVKVVASCVSTALLDATRQAVDGTSAAADGFSSVGYDALLDAVTAISTAPIADIVATVDAAVPGDSADALANGALRISAAMPGDFSGASRGADTSPYWGGARIWTDVGGCTTGFYLNSSTNGTVMLTAGHCYGGNGVSTDNGNHTAVVGTSEGRSIDPDTALIDGQSYYRRSYSWNDQTSNKLISEASNPTTGVVYCQMGATSLRICSAYSALDVDADYGGHVRHHLAYTSGPSGPGGSLGSAGDSGAGTYRELSGGTLGARGDVVAAGCNVTTCARWDTKLQTILSLYSATVVTSG